jgi:diguanylate cyclase (GGDEF)-like protein
MGSLRTIKLLLGGIMGLFVVATAYTSMVIVDRQEALQETSRYNVAWLAGQATSEFARLGERISASALPGAGVDADEVRLRYDILLNRLKLFEGGDFRAFVRSDPEQESTVREFAAALARAEPFIDGIDRPGAAVQARDILAPIEGKLARLAGAANRYGGDRAAEDQKELLSLHWTFSSLAVALILCGIGLTGLLVWHNRLLERAHGEVHGLADDLRHTSGQLDTALNNMSQGLCMVDGDQRLTVCNGRYLSLFGLTRETARAGTPIAELFGGRGAALKAVCAEQELLIREGRPGAYLTDLADGRTLAVSHQPMPNGGWVATYEDITERRQVEARIAHMAHHDALTDLPNRALFGQRMDDAFTRVRRHGEAAAVLCLDLDRFKVVNDTLGHPIGDALLQVVADRLRECVRDTDTVARLGGDEFAILQVGAEQPRAADALARRVAEVIAAPYEIEGNEIVIGTSIGIAVATSGDVEGDQLLKSADLALYRAKLDGRGAHRFFEPEMDAQIQARRAVELDLRVALARDEFELHYQALVDLRSDTIVGYEALLRWYQPERGLVSPAVFIPIAEEIGLIGAIGEWVIRRACAEASAWPGGIKVAVNLSPVQFRNRKLVSTVVSALAAAGLPADRLEVEITESVLLQNNEDTLATLHQLRELGVRISMDDFGTGYSSLNYLRSFPFDKIKIDQSFVRDITKGHDSLAIVQSIAALGTTLRIATTAEGIETVEQLEEVRAAGCTEGQGYLFARPKPSRELVHEPIWRTVAAA